LILKTTANISTGGTAIDRTDEAHPENIFCSSASPKSSGLDVIGIDIIAPNITEPLRENGGGIIEVNAGAGFSDASRAVEGNRAETSPEYVVNMLFPPGRPFRIPIFAVHRNERQNDDDQVIAHILRGSGCVVGLRRPTELIFRTIKSRRATIRVRFRRSLS
jgi:cyanophycin synthetase